jgi:glutaminyl-peptide cyclotransferase
MMKKLSAMLTVGLLFGCSRGGEAALQFDGEQALSYVEAQMNFGNRIPNTEAHRRTGDWILAHLESRADSVEVQSFTHVTADGDTLMLRNFVGKFRPDASERILFVAHWDTRPVAENERNMARRRLPTPGANDGASGVALLLGVADELDREPPAYGVDLLLVDGEDYGDFGANRDVLLGSRYFAENLPEDYRPLYAVVFDMVGAADVTFPREWYSEREAPEVVNRVWRTARELGFEDVFRADQGTSVTDDHIPLQEAGIRAIDVIGWPYDHHHTTDDTLDKVSARSLAVVGTVALALVR